MRKLTISAIGTSVQEIDEMALRVANAVNIIESQIDYDEVNVGIQVVPGGMLEGNVEVGGTNVIGFHYDETCEGYDEEEYDDDLSEED